MDLNKSSVPQYCILFRLILQVARFSIAFYFVNISLVPVHSPLSILPGPAQCGLWFQFGDSALRTEGSNPDPSQGNEGRRQTLSNLSEYHGTGGCLSVTEDSPQSHLFRQQSQPVSVNITICLLSKPHPPSIIQAPQWAELCSDKTPSLLPLCTIWAIFSLRSSRIKLDSVLSKLVLWYHNLKLQYYNPLLDHFNPIIAPQTDYGG